MMESVYIAKNRIKYDLEARNTAEVIHQMSQMLYESHSIDDREAFEKSVWEREKEIATNIGKEVAIPHGKSTSVKESTIAMAKLTLPITWAADSDDQVQYVFLLAIRDGDEKDAHLRQLAELSTRLMDDQYLDSVKKAQSLDELFRALNAL